MPLYRYTKTYPKRRRRLRLPRIFPFLLMGSGILLMLWVTWPILSFRLISQDLFAGTIAPVPTDGVAVNPVVPNSVQAAQESVNGEKLSYTNPNIWFPNKPQKKVVTPVNTYRLSIPKLRIKDANVVIAGDDLKKSLIHYGGTALPGEYGNTVIFGHSTLPQLYDPENYTTIFSLLPTLKVGDEIFVTYDGITYKYAVVEMTVHKPDDLSTLEQRFDDRYLTLVTCVPPGTYWERLSVRAKLVPL